MAIRKGWRGEVVRALETFRGLDLADEGRSSRPIFAKMTICVKWAWRDHHEWFVVLLSLSPERFDNLVTGGSRFLESFPEGRHVSFPGCEFGSTNQERKFDSHSSLGERTRITVATPGRVKKRPLFGAFLGSLLQLKLGLNNKVFTNL